MRTSFRTKVVPKADLRLAWKESYQRHPLLKSDHSKRICDLISGSPQFQAAGRVTLFSALPWEVDVSRLWDLRPTACLFPRVVGTALQFFTVESMKDFSVGYAGIWEPKGLKPVTPLEAKDLVLVPGFAFDEAGGRVGSGKGFYDRFLEKCPAIRWGVCLSAQVSKEVIAQEATDARMDAIVTEKGIIQVTP